MRHQRLAFTLVELLVVVAIVGVLLAMMLPAVQHARAAARSTECKSNMRQIGLGILQYCDTHRGYFPQTMHAGEENSWVYTIAPFLENVDAIRICPDDPIGRERMRAKSTSYIVNDYIALDVPHAVRKLQQLEATTTMMLAFEGADRRSTDFQNEHAHASRWFSPLNVDDGLVLWAIEQDLQLDRHGDTANYLFADAHVDTIPRAKIIEWVDEGFEFARPNQHSDRDEQL